MRTETVENTNSLTENTETEIVISDIIRYMSSKANLSDAQKYHLLKNHFKPPPACKFPSKYIHQCRRQFKVNC